MQILPLSSSVQKKKGGKKETKSGIQLWKKTGEKKTG